MPCCLPACLPACPPSPSRSPVPHGYLVVLPAGDNFNASKLLDRPHMANWDLGGCGRCCRSAPCTEATE